MLANVALDNPTFDWQVIKASPVQGKTQADVPEQDRWNVKGEIPV